MTQIQLSREFSSELSALEKRREKGDGDASYLLKLIDKGVEKLSDDYECGQKIQKRLWPRYYVAKYGISNLWRLRLDGYWRMIYTVTGDHVRIVAVILEVLDHREYDKRFGYK
jgi:mRNA-degrading endonuclease RelE of RelBE toxin-antitoxin system